MPEETHGFELVQHRLVPELHTEARFYRHVRTGAELLSLVSDDENKVFGVAFRTPPADSTGIAHILEHSVLCGSRKYPVKEPFVELLKGSLQTFLNAMTYPDKTCYPVASQNRQDFYNLIDVYLDAVFYPRLTPQVLRQEGWHYEVESEDAPLSLKGVVFNEMKGVYSSPDALLGEASQQCLFPDTTYGLDSGGDPAHIPELTFEQFSAFHKTLYHPSNARVFFSGDDPPGERLRLLDAWFSAFERAEADSAVALQPLFDAPRRESRPFAAAAGSPEAERGLATVNWLLPDPLQPARTMAFEILGHILLGTSASPLHKALIDSGLGEEVTGGHTSLLRQMTFSAGLRGIAPDCIPDMEQLVLDTLGRLAGDGIDADMVEAAMNTVEFALRENNTGGFPRGLALMLRALVPWLHDADPIGALAFEAPLAELKSTLARDPRFFEGLIAEHLVRNPHRVTLSLVPDTGLAARRDAAERERLEAVRAGLSADERRRLVEETRELKAAQERPDPPEALAAIPSLQLTDLDRRNRLLPLEEPPGEPRIWHSDLFTNGIVYLNVGFDLRTLAPEQLPYLSLFRRALLQTGTDTEDFVTFSRRIGRKTGGVWTSPLLGTALATRAAEPWLFLRAKCLPEQVGEATEILHDALRRARLDDRDRVLQLAREAKSGMEAGLIPGGHGVVARRLRRLFSEAGWLDEQLGGLDQLFFLRDLIDRIERDWPSVLAVFEDLRARLFNAPSMLGHVTATGEALAAARGALAALAGRLPSTPARREAWNWRTEPRAEGYALPAQVNYVGKGASLYEAGYRFHGSILAISRYLHTTWLWERVRVQGGAYGGFCRFDRGSGVWSYGSYRDPNLVRTWTLFDRTAEFLRTAPIGADEVRKSIIGAIGDLDPCLLPDAKGFAALTRRLTGDTDEDRQRMREELLGATEADFRRFAEVLDAVARDGVPVVMGSPEALAQAAPALPGGLEVIRVL